MFSALNSLVLVSTLFGFGPVSSLYSIIALNCVVIMPFFKYKQ